MGQQEIISSNESAVSFAMETARLPATHRMLFQMLWEAIIAKHAVALITMGTMGQRRHPQPPGGVANPIWKFIAHQVSYNMDLFSWKLCWHLFSSSSLHIKPYWRFPISVHHSERKDNCSSSDYTEFDGLKNKCARYFWKVGHFLGNDFGRRLRKKFVGKPHL